MYNDSGYLHVKHQLGFSASETIRDKQNFERLAMDHDVIVDSYLSENGFFVPNPFSCKYTNIFSKSTNVD